MSHIVIDTRPLQTPNSRERGIGYLTRGWLSEFLKQPCNHRISLLIDPRFDPPDIPLRGSFWQPLAFQSTDRLYIQPTLRDEIAARERTEQFLQAQQADLFHMTSPFESEVVTGLLPMVCHTVATFYDATQVIFPDECLRPGGPDYVLAYHAKLQSLRDCDRIVAISHWSAGDLLRFTRTPVNRIEVVHPAPSWDSEIPRDVESVWLQRIQQPYILAVLGAIPIKNVERLLAAYSNLSAELQAQYKLVIVYRIPNDYHRNEIHAWRQKYHIAERVLFTDYVARDELRTLYAHALAVVHPSLYEGFGMPILDAMAAGKPVIASNTSSMPEIVGDAGLLVDPLNTSSITEALVRVLTDADLRMELGRRALIQARQYSWRRSAQAMREVYERTLISPKSLKVSSGMQAAQLGELADVTDRRYRVQSKAPLLAPIIVWLRNNLTSHLREPYFDIMVERQTQLNKDIARRIQATAWQLGSDELPSRVPIVESPRPCYSECLGSSFFRDLYNAYIIGAACADIPRQHANLRIIARIQQLGWMLQYFNQQADILAGGVPLLNRADMIYMGNYVQSRVPLIGPVIVWLRRRLTDQLQRHHIDEVISRQMIFNRLIIECLQLGNNASVSGIGFERLQSCADIEAHNNMGQTNVHWPNELLNWFRDNFTWHLLKPYIRPIFARQIIFNYAVIKAIKGINTKLILIPSQRVSSVDERHIYLRKSLETLRQDVDELGEIADFSIAVHRLIQRMQSCI